MHENGAAPLENSRASIVFDYEQKIVLMAHHPKLFVTISRWLFPVAIVCEAGRVVRPDICTIQMPDLDKS